MARCPLRGRAHVQKPGSPIQAPMGRRDRGEQSEHLLIALDTCRRPPACHQPPSAVKGTQEWDFGRDHDIATSQLYATETWKNFWTSQVTYTANARHEDPRLTRGGPRMQVPSAWSIDALLRNNTSSQTSWSGEVILGGTEDGGLTHQVIGHLGFRPGPRWQLSVDPNFLHQVDTQQYVTTANGGGAQTYGKRYVFGTIDRSTYSTQFRLNYTFKPDVNLDVYAEPFAASGFYSNLGELAAASTRLLRIYGVAAGRRRGRAGAIRGSDARSWQFGAFKSRRAAITG
jgi:hypothetical protein